MGRGWLRVPCQESPFCNMRQSCLGDAGTVHGSFRVSLFTLVWNSFFEEATTISPGPKAQGREISNQWIEIQSSLSV